MRRFLLTSPKKKGSIEAIYNFDGQLCRMDFTGMPCDATETKWVKDRTPILVQNIDAAFLGTTMKATETEFSVTFQDFQREYNYNRNTHLARDKEWPKLTSSIQYTCLIAAIEYRHYCQRNASWYKPMIMDKWIKTKQYLNNWKEL